MKLHWKITKLILRVQTAWKILTGRYKHWTMIVLTREDLQKLLLEKDFDVQMVDYGMRRYNALLLVKLVSELYDADEMTLLKAQYEAEAMERGVDMDKIDELRNKE